VIWKGLVRNAKQQKTLQSFISIKSVGVDINHPARLAIGYIIKITGLITQKK
jgi:hypothetical protein